MQIHVARDGRELGIFSAEEVRAALVSGKFRPTDFGWMDGQADWAPLTGLPGLAPLPAQPPPNAHAPAASPTALPENSGSVEVDLPPSQSAPASRVVSSRAAAGPKSRLAMVSMVLGVASLSIVPLLPALPAILCGHLARGRIRRSDGALGGDGVALGGLICGYLSLFLFGLVGASLLLLAR